MVDKEVVTPEQQLHQLATKLHQGQLSAQEQSLLAELLDNEPGEVLMSVTRQQLHVGPLPPPDLLNQYDDATRQTILSMASKEQAHAHDMQQKSLQGAIAKDRRGQVIGGVIAVAGLVAAAAIAPYSTVAAAIIGSLDLFGMVALFVAPRILEKRSQS
ncbi:MAG: DUF2335 domain-containing protein [Marinospirillum sp.]|uniref:DUF2335 domain-containing protein n=1 Tax=Marinospirillum sp. TaxID=2183934 RepID=UPI0019FAC3E6|nr:DUF2335 domain-containing protein [Marinospirillum sp.]MBE0508374.1 DUF2335 domain-containing protein [Marinospirillum sp.]